MSDSHRKQPNIHPEPGVDLGATRPYPLHLAHLDRDQLPAISLDVKAYDEQSAGLSVHESAVSPETSQTIDKIIESFDGIGALVKAAPGTTLRVPGFPPLLVYNETRGYVGRAYPEGSALEKWVNRGVSLMGQVINVENLRARKSIGPTDNSFFTIKYLDNGQALLACMAQDSSGEGDLRHRAFGLQCRLFSLSSHKAAEALNRIVVVEKDALAYREFLDRATPGFEKAYTGPQFTDTPGIRPDYSSSVTYIRYDNIQPALVAAESYGLAEAAYSIGQFYQLWQAPGTVTRISYPADDDQKFGAPH